MTTPSGCSTGDANATLVHVQPNIANVNARCEKARSASANHPQPCILTNLFLDFTPQTFPPVTSCFFSVCSHLLLFLLSSNLIVCFLLSTFTTFPRFLLSCSLPCSRFFYMYFHVLSPLRRRTRRLHLSLRYTLVIEGIGFYSPIKSQEIRQDQVENCTET